MALCHGKVIQIAAFPTLPSLEMVHATPMHRTIPLRAGTTEATAARQHVTKSPLPLAAPHEKVTTLVPMVRLVSSASTLHRKSRLSTRYCVTLIKSIALVMDIVIQRITHLSAIMTVEIAAKNRAMMILLFIRVALACNRMFALIQNLWMLILRQRCQHPLLRRLPLVNPQGHHKRIQQGHHKRIQRQHRQRIQRQHRQNSQ